jgi:hypothetical protein
MQGLCSITLEVIGIGKCVEKDRGLTCDPSRAVVALRLSLRMTAAWHSTAELASGQELTSQVVVALWR